MLTIRRFQSLAAETLWPLKFRTVSEVNIRGYAYEQVSVWCPNEYDEGAWLARISEINPFVVEKNGVIAAYVAGAGWVTMEVNHVYVQPDAEEIGDPENP